MIAFHGTSNEAGSSPNIEDDRMRLVVERRLQMSNYGPVRSVRCVALDGVVSLYGALPSFHLKQVAQTLVRHIELVMQVENHCEVVYEQQNE